MPPIGATIGGMTRRDPLSIASVPPDGRLSGVDLAALPVPTKVTRIVDGGGLSLELRPSGARYWRIRYFRDSRENRLSVGVFPEVDLEQARAVAADVRAQIAQGIDPSKQRKAERVERRAAAAESRADAGRFQLSHRGALAVELPGRRAFVLTPAETRDLRAFLSGTVAVGE